MINFGEDYAMMRDFILGRLSHDERREFEDRLVREPALVRELEQSLQMRAGLQALRTQGYFGKAASRPSGFRNWAPMLAAAACAALALFLWLSYVTGPSPILTPSLESLSAGKGAPRLAAHFTFVSMRGGLVPELDLPSGGVIDIRAAPGTSEEVHRYRVTLERQNTGRVVEPIASLGGLALGADGYVHVYADASHLVRGSYVLRIQPDAGAPGTEDVFPFNLRASGAPSPQ